MACSRRRTPGSPAILATLCAAIVLAAAPAPAYAQESTAAGAAANPAVVEDPVSADDDLRTPQTVDSANPELSEWLVKQSEGLGSYVGSTDVSDMLEGAFSNVLGTEHALEGTLAARMEGLVPKGFRGKLSSAMAYVIILLPLALVGYASFRAGKNVTLRQYVLVANLCNLVFIATVFTWYLISGDDPVELMVVLSPRLVIFVQMCVALQFPCFCVLLLAAIMASVTKKQKMYFIFQLVLYFAMAFDYRKRIWKPTLQKQIFESQTIFAYMIYLAVLSFMTYLTVRSAKVERSETIVSEVEAVMTNVQKNATDVVMEAVDPTSATTDTDKIN